MFVTSQLALTDQLSAVATAMLAPVGAVDFKVKLAVAPFAPSPTSDPTTFTEATFDGYALKTATAWQTPYLVFGGASETIPTTILHWSPTGSIVTNLIVGYWVLGSNADYLGGEVFPTPIPMGSPADAINLVPKWQVPVAGWSATLVP